MPGQFFASVNRFAVVALIGLTFAAPRASAQDAPAPTDRDFPMGQQGILRIGVPSGWKDDSILADAGSVSTSMLDFSNRDNSGPIRVQVISFPPAKIDPNLAADEVLRNICRGMASNAVGAAKAKEVKIEPFNGTEAHGFCYSVPDETKSKGYGRISGGALKLGQLIVVYTILHQERQALLEPATKMIREARLVTDASTAATKPAAPVALPGPGDAWFIRIPNLVIAPSSFVRRKQGDTLDYTLTDRVSGIGLNALIEPAPKRGGAIIARNYYHNSLKQSRTQLEKVKLEGNNAKALLRYRVSGMQCVSVYLVHENMWVSVNFVCSADDKEALAQMEQAVNSVVVSE